MISGFALMMRLWKSGFGMCRDTIHRHTNKGFDGRWLLVVWGEDPGWNPGLNEAEALAPDRKASELTSEVNLKSK